MKENVLMIILLLPITAFLIAGVLVLKGKISKEIISFTRYITYSGIVISIISGAWLFTNGTTLSPSLSFQELGISFRLDTLSLVMYTMIALIGLVVIRFSYNYLEGDENHYKFIGRLSITIAFVQILVLSENLFIFFTAWVGTGLSLNKLLLFYPQRKNANLGAKKKLLVSRLGDLSLLLAFVLIYLEFGTGNLSLIFQKATLLESGSGSIALELAVILLVLSAALKSAQLPFHGWLLEVMEAPTPVSALLHAGLINAGPFLMIRCSYLIESVYYAPILLFTVGAITALYGSMVFSTQPTVKTALAYSSVGHMGFSLMTCGLGLYSAGLLHLVAHSFYKAHAFLSSGSLVETVQTSQKYGFTRKGNVLKIVLGFLIASGIYVGVAQLWGITINTEYQLLIIGGIIYAGSITLFVNALDSTSSFLSIIKSFGTALLVLNMFFGLEALTSFYIGAVVPALSTPSSIIIILSGATLALCFLTVLVQTILPILTLKSSHKNFGVHLRNGFYINVVLNKMLKSLDHKN